MEATQVDAMKNEGWITVINAAVLARVNQQTIYRWIRSGDLESTKVGARLYVSRDSLLRKLGPVASRALGLTSPSGGAA